MIKKLLAPPLNPGDTIGIAAPAGQISDSSRFDSGLKILHDLGFCVKYPRNLWPGTGYLSDTDENRIAEFNRLWGDPEVKAILALRGGYGCLRMVKGIDLKHILHNPKLFIGFSDLTVLHNHINANTGLVTLHGPVLTSLTDCSRDALERFYHCLTGNWDHNIIPEKLEILRGGVEAQGSLTGGNLSTLITVLGTRFDCDWKGKIVVLEDTNEPLYRIDRMLTQLYYAGKFQDVKAILLGDFSHVSHMDGIDRLRHHEVIWNRMLELTEQQQTVVWGNFPTGHCPNNITLPMGTVALLDSNKPQLRFL